jgi:CRISPR-associated protein Cmr1
MKKEDYQISFNVPAFLGDAEQKSAWRTPPFKALIQQWWRVAVAKEHNYDWHKIRESEGRLFGHAWLKDNSGKDWAMRSRVRIRLEQFKPGTLEKDKWQFNEKKVNHPEVGFGVGSDLYLGFGPLLYSKENKRTELKQTSIKAEEENSLTLIYPKQNEETFKQIIQLMHWFGTLGGRSRNGWGSIAVKAVDLTSVGATPTSRQANDPQDYATLLNGKANLTPFQRSLTSCLTLEWPHAIGEDEKGVLIWKTEACKSWMQVMRTLAEIKIGFRTESLAFKQNKDKTNPVLDERHILSYPVTHHGVSGWAELDRHGKLKQDKRGYLIQKHRIANQLRFKVICQDQNFYGLIFHLPCAVTEELAKEVKGSRDVLNQQETIWRKVHQHLDQHLQRTASLNHGK